MQLSSQDSLASQASASFMSKTFSFFGLAILVSALGVYTGFNFLLNAFLVTPGLMMGIFIAEIILIFSSGWWSKKEPLGYFLFSLFAFLSGLTLVPLLLNVAAEFGSFDLIYRALFATTAMFFGMGVIGYKMEKPILGLSGFLTMALIGMLITGLLGIFFPWGNTGEMLYSGFGIVLFAAYAMVDVQRLKMSQQGSPMMAAMNLYLDIVNLFIFVLRFLSARSRD